MTTKRLRTHHRAWALLAASVLVLAACGPGAATAMPEPTDLTPTTEELTLLSGMRLDLAERCLPLREELPEAALAGLECVPEASQIGAARIYLFNDREAMLQRYLDVLAVGGVQPDTEGAGLPIGESSYVPSEPGGPLTDTRHGHFVDGEGHGRYAVTFPPFVLLVVAGTDANVNALYDWAWRGNQDVPGGPTIWSANGPRDPESKG
jgi:hypothetical protein